MAGADFETGNVHTFPGAFNAGMDIVSGADGKFYLAHSASGSQIDIKQWDGTQWAAHSSLTASQVGAERFGPFDLIVGPDEQLHITYQQTIGPDNNLGRGLGYGSYDGSVWSLSIIEEVVPYGAGTYFYPADIAIDDDGNAHLTYVYSSPNYPGYTRGIAYATNVSGSWESSPVSEWESTLENGISKLSIHVDDSDVVHLIYQQSDVLYHVTKSAASWDDRVDITPPSPGSGTIVSGDPFIGSDGNIYLWYLHEQTDVNWNFLSSTVYGFIHQGGSWATETAVTSTTQPFGVLDLQEVDGTQYLLVQRYTSDYTALDLQLYVRPENGSWQIGNEVDLSGYFAKAVLALNPDGEVMVAALDQNQENIVYAFGVPLGSPNAAPIVEASLGDSAFIEGAPVVVDADLDVSDADNATLASATVSISSGFQPGDALDAGGPFGNIAASYNPATGVLTLTSAGSTATVAQWQSMLRSVTFEHATDAPSADDRVITFQINDGAKSSVAANKTVTVTGVNDDPTGSVVITGIALRGQTLTADASAVEDADGLGIFTYQWLANGAEIAGATGNTHVLTQDEVDKAITVRVSYTDGQGTLETLNSEATPTVINVNDDPTGLVTITGIALQGQTLTADTSSLDDADGLGVLSYQWLANGVEIYRATDSTYVLTQDEVNKAITVRVSYIDGQGTSEAVLSTATSTVINVNDDPTGSVTITGTALQGETLTADTSSVDDVDGPGVLSHQWLADGTEIIGAIASSYVLTQSEVGKAISVRVSYVDGQGTLETLTSTPTAAVINVNDEPDGSVTIDGIALQGQTLTANISTLADVDGLGVLSYQWLVNGVEIIGANASTHILTQDDVDNIITVRVDYTDGQGTAESLTSMPTIAVANVNDLPSGAVVIAGSPTQGQTLIADTGAIDDLDGLGAFSYQWLADGVEILGATAHTYDLTQAEVGKAITVRIDYTDAQGTAESLTSTATSLVANVNDLPTGAVVITGTARQAETLTADASSLADIDGLGAASYQWLADGNEISGATSDTYVLTQTEVGKSITVRVDYVDGEGTPEAPTSTATAAVENVNDEPEGAILIDGIALQGETLLADTSTLADIDGLSDLGYQWLANGVEIPGANAGSYTLTQNEVGKAITVRVDYTDDQGTAETLSSTATLAVVNVNDEPGGDLILEGTAQQGETLSADTSTITDIDVLGPFNYQWLANGFEIPGANASTYALTQADVGSVISVRVSYTDGQGTLETLTSSATPAVANINDEPAGAVTITGTPLQGETLTADTSTLADTDGLGSLSYQWLADGVEIDGATGDSYVLTQAEVGKPITVRVSYTDGFDADESVVSTPTASVENVNDAPVGTVIITGEIDQGETLSADISGLSDPDGISSVTYQWQADGVDIPGATGDQYVLTQAEVGKGVSVVVRYTDGGGYAESVASTATAAIRNVNDAPTLSGLPEQPVHIPTFPSTKLPDIVIDDIDDIDGADEVLTLTLVATNARLSDLDDIDPIEPGIQISGTAAELNSLLAQASLRPTGKGDAALDLTLTDGDGASHSATIAYVVHSLPPTPPAEPDLIDGVAVTVRTVTEPGSGVLRETSIPIVTESRQDTVDDSPLADIPLVTSGNNTDLLAVRVPVGFGVTARGASAPLPASSSLDGLIAAIRAHTEADSDVQQTMLGGGAGFLQSLNPTDELLVHRLVLAAASDAPPAQPLVISGTPASAGLAATALVIDASQLPAGSVIHLENVAFAVIIGAVQVAGGSGAQIVYADDAAQTLVLGEADDTLFAGGGDDTVGSAEGDDHLYGNVGDDVLFGGPGQDFLHGGSGDDVATFDGDSARYVVTRDHAVTTVQSLDDPTDVDTLVNIETLQFADGVIDIENDDTLGHLAGLYQQVLHRQAELDGFQYWAKAHAAGMNLGDIARSFVWSDEALSQPGTDDPIARAATVEVLYEQLLNRLPDEEGQAYWVDRLADGMTLSDVAVSILFSDEMQALLPAPSDWDFFV